jgi:small subunit ribosomal protein S6
MRSYELMMISHGSLDEPGVQQNVERFSNLIADQGGTVERVDHWGKRQFAYEIDHMWEGYYTVIDLAILGPGLAEVERQLRLADEVVRHKVVRPAPRTKKRAS